MVNKCNVGMLIYNPRAYCNNYPCFWHFRVINVKKIEKVHVMFKYKIDISEIWHNNLIIQDKNRETTAALDKLTKQNQIEKYSKEMFFNS